MSVADTLRTRFNTLADQEGIDTSGIDLTPTPQGRLRVRGDGIDRVVWGNSGVREIVNELGGTSLSGGSDPASRSADAERQEIIEDVAETPVRIAGEADAETLANFPSLESDRTFVSGQADRISVTVYDEDRASPDNRFPTLEFERGRGRLERFVEGIRTLGPEGVRAALDDATADEELYEAAAGRDERRAIREAGRDALPEIVDNPEEYDIGASDGRLILQDADTGRTESVDVSGPGEVGTAIDAAAGDLAPEADGPGGGPTPTGDGSGDSLTAAAAAVVLAIVGVALAWVGGN